MSTITPPDPPPTPVVPVSGIGCPVILLDPDPCVDVAFLAEECYPDEVPVNLGIYYDGLYMYGDAIVYAEGS